MLSVSPGAYSPLILGIAGLPGSGKTHLIASGLGHGRYVLDDINNNWAEGVERARIALAGRQEIVVADIMFCHAGWRQRIAEELGLAVAWTFFSNDPIQCMRNCTHRIARGEGPRTIAHELRMIEILTQIYQPEGDVVPVYRPTAERP
jgi:hypothetical protein